MNFLKKNMVLVVGGAISLLLALILVVVLIRVRSSYVRVQRELNLEQQKLVRLNQRDPYPSDENVEIIQTNYVVLQKFFRELMALLRQGQEEPRAIEPAEFPVRLDRTIRALWQKAAAQKVVLPQRFAFGFDRYMLGTLPAREDVYRLVIQLDTIAHLCDVLFQCKINELVSVERPLFEASLRISTEETQWEAQEEQPELQEEEIPYQDPSKLFTRERYRITFRGTDASVREVLNRLAAHRRFFAVSRVELDNEGGVPTVAPPPSQPTSGVAPILTHEDRVVAGRELVRATISVDVYRFLTASAAEVKS